MISADDIEKAKVLLAEDKLEEAMSLLDKLVADKDNELKDEAYYVRGNAFRRGNHWKEAINNYTRAIELNPQSPAAAMKASCIEILDFFNKDMFNPKPRHKSKNREGTNKTFVPSLYLRLK